MNAASASSSTRIKVTQKLRSANSRRPDTWCILCRLRTIDCDCVSDADDVKPTPWWEQDKRGATGTARTITTEERTFRHAHWQDARDRVMEAMHAAKVGSKKLERFATCGCGCQVEWSETLQRNRVRGQFCKDRHCEPCQASKANRIRQNLQNQLTGIQRNSHRFVTLTLAHTDEPLKHQIARLYAAFKKLRRSELWKKSQVGGCFMLEVKLTTPKNETRRDGTKSKPHEWHPHLHVVTQGGWINLNELKNLWHQITSDSWCVDVRLLARENDVAAYVSKYVTKGTSPEVWRQPDFAAEWIEASRGVRSCATFGTWRGLKLTAPVAIAFDWIRVGSLVDLIRRSRSGEENALHILLSLRPPGQDVEDMLTAQ
jgi:hypothetical protein